MAVRRLLVPLLALAATVLAVAAASAQPSEWYNAGSELVGDDGTWAFSGRIVPVNLVQEGLTYLRVTNGPCNGSPNAYVVYEVNLMAPPADEDAWFGTLAPVGTQAGPTGGSASDPNAYVRAGSGDTSTVIITLTGQTPNTTLSACFGKPSS